MSELLVGSRLPDLRTVLVDLILRYRMKRVTGGPLTADGMRRAASAFAKANEQIPVPPFVSIEPVKIGAIEGEWISLRDQPKAAGVILYFHGGGFVMGSPQTHRVVTWRLARATGRRVLAIAYRKEPDHAFPAWLDDGAAAFHWLLDQGYAAKDVLFSGDSAGGNLALTVTHRQRRQRLPIPGGLVLFSPWADLACRGRSYRSNSRREAMFHAENVRSTGAYLTRGCDPLDPEVSPVHADLTGFPPMLLFAGTRELFVDDARALAQRAAASGVRVELHVYRHMPHVFPLLAGFLPRAKPAYATIARFVAEISGPGSAERARSPQVAASGAAA
jgi:monoterpene epsilon-lactone hydrolase